MNQFLHSLALLPIENTLNSLIKRDQHIASQLQSFENKSIEVIGTSPGFTLTVRFEERSIKLSAIDSETLGLKPDATITARTEALVGLLIQISNNRALADPAITLSGNAALIQDLHFFIDSFDVDWQDYLTPLVGDILSNELGKFAEAAKSWSSAVGISARRNVYDYLGEEARLVPGKAEVESFTDRLDQLRLQIDRAQAKAEQFGRRLALASERQ